MTNQEFADTNKEFRAACERAKIPPTKRQASKFKLGFGRAWECRNGHPIDKDREERINLSPE